MISWCTFDLPEKELELSKLEKESEDPNLWENQEHAQKVMKKIVDLRDELEGWKSFSAFVQDTKELAEMADASFRTELEENLEAIEKELDQRELSTLLSGKYDRGNALLSIHAGAGGTDSQDWAEMLERMYLRWADKNGFSADILDRSAGEEAGLKSVTIAINGKYAYGYLKSEKGVHRLVRLSPFRFRPPPSYLLCTG